MLTVLLSPILFSPPSRVTLLLLLRTCFIVSLLILLPLESLLFRNRQQPISHRRKE